MKRDYRNFYARSRPMDFPLWHPWSGAGLATGWAIAGDLPLGSLIGHLVWGDKINSMFALAWLVLFPIAVYVFARIHFDRMQYETVWDERRATMRCVLVVSAIYLFMIFYGRIP